MITIENIVGPSDAQMKFAIEGMRNPMNSWDRSDSEWDPDGIFDVGDKDFELMYKLAQAGPTHRKYLRMLPICMRITAPLYWWKEFDTYKVGTVSNSCSTMHKITAKEFTLDDFSYEHLNTYALTLLQNTITLLNIYRQTYLDCNLDDMDEVTKKDIWWQIIQLLPSSYNQTRNIMLNYEVLVNIYQTRKDHKLDEWRVFCERIEKIPCLGIFLRRMEEDK